jgi:hypothetical protein
MNKGPRVLGFKESSVNFLFLILSLDPYLISPPLLGEDQGGVSLIFQDPLPTSP